MVQLYWVSFPCRGILLILIIVGQGSIAVGAGGGCSDIFTLVYHFSFLSPGDGLRQYLSQKASWQGSVQ